MTTIPPEFQSIYETGEALQSDICAHLNAWPSEIKTLANNETREIYLVESNIPPEFANKSARFTDRTHAWINLIARDVLPHTTYTRYSLNQLIQRITQAIYGHWIDDNGNRRWMRHPSEVINVISDAINIALRLIRTASPTEVSGGLNNHSSTTSFAPNTAFIMMSMDPNNPQLEDVLTAVKRVFEKFDIKAVRADEIEHQDSVTQVVLDQIKRVEFLFADLSYERPNVYYEVGYAHAIGKRPILYRLSGTRLHFDLSIHNVPEYANVTTLERLLSRRLASMTGREPNQ